MWVAVDIQQYSNCGEFASICGDLRFFYLPDQGCPWNDQLIMNYEMARV